MQPDKTDICDALYRSTTAPIRVTYRDTDRMGYAYHSQYLVWFEIGRTELLRCLGTAYAQWEDEEGVYLPVRSCDVRYLVPLRYDELLIVHTSMVKLTRASVTFQYSVTRPGSPQVMATGSTVHAFVNKDGLIVRVADKLLPQFFP